MFTCAWCAGKGARDVISLVINYAGSVGLHIILDNHRSENGQSAQENGLWYTNDYPEQRWIADWVRITRWVNGVGQTIGGADTVTLNQLASDGFPIVMGFDLRNEPHVVGSAPPYSGALWGSGDGIDPAQNPNPNPFAVACAATSTCRDWRLAAERAGDTILGESLANQWSYPLIFVEGVANYPMPAGTFVSGPFDWTWWGGDLRGVNGNSGHPGAPIVLNAGGDAQLLGPSVANQLVYSAHDYGPDLFQQPWFNAQTCYVSGCSPSSLADVWFTNWAHLSAPGGVDPRWPDHPAYPWSNTGAEAYTTAPVWIGEFGTGNNSQSLNTSGPGSVGEWFTDLINFIQSSYTTAPANASGHPVQWLNWSYWTVNPEPFMGLYTSSWQVFAYPPKQYTFLCSIQRPPFALPAGSGAGQCGSTGALPVPVSIPSVPTNATAISAVPSGATITWTAPYNGGSPLTGYRVQSTTDINGFWFNVTTCFNITQTTCTDSTATTGTFFRVAALNAVGLSAYSAPVGILVPSGFTDDPILPGVTTVKAIHVLELRARIAALRGRFMLPAFPWAEATLAGARVSASHILELRTALGAVYTAALRTPPVYADPGLGPGTTIKAAHVNELRGAVKGVE